MRCKKISLVYGLISCCVWLSANAQFTDQSFTTTSDDCAGVHWSAETLKKYPTIVPACQSVETHKGMKYVKFSAKILKVGNQGRDLTLKLKDGGEVTVAMPLETNLNIDGRSKPLSNLRNGDEVNFYVPQSRVVAQFHSQPELSAQEAPAYTATFHTTISEQPIPGSERVASTLPETAGDTYSLALLAALMLSLAAGLAIVRRYRR